MGIERRGLTHEPEADSADGTVANCGHDVVEE